MLGPASLRQHIESKKHLGRLKRKAEDYEPICIATGQQVMHVSAWCVLSLAVAPVFVAA